MTDRDALLAIKGICEAQLGAVVVPVVPPVVPPTLPPSVGSYVEGVYTGRGNWQLINLASGQIWCAPLPDTGGLGSGTIKVGEVAGSPQPRTIEICISKTKGLIDPAGNYVSADNEANPSWLARSVLAGSPGRGQTIINGDNAKQYGMMWAPGGPWFVNLRYTYPGEPGAMHTTWANGPWV